jgi:hypothetical protein
MLTARLLSCLQLFKADFNNTDCLQHHSVSLRTPNRTMLTARPLSCLQLTKADYYESDCRTNAAALFSDTYLIRIPENH